jgi:flagellar hook-basal body complex protein FliE
MSIAGVTDVRPVAPAAGRAETGSSGKSSDFAAQFEAALSDLGNTAQAADTTSEGLVTGEVDIHEAMVAMEKADLALRVAGTVRTKVIDAYQQLLSAFGG